MNDIQKYILISRCVHSLAQAPHIMGPASWMIPQRTALQLLGLMLMATLITILTQGTSAQAELRLRQRARKSDVQRSPIAPPIALHCDIAGIDQLVFKKAHADSATFWWPDGYAPGKYGETYEGIQKWFDTLEKPGVKVAQHVFTRAASSGEEKMFMDVGSHQGWYSMIAGYQGLDVAAFDMQPYCVQLFQCAALTNGYKQLSIRNVYVTDAETAATNRLIDMPDGMCHGGSSPSGPGFGIPHASTVGVPPLDLTSFLNHGVLKIALMKIDTEGYEPIVLEAIHASDAQAAARVESIMVEVSPGSWAAHNITKDKALEAFAPLFSARFKFVAVYLPEGLSNPAQFEVRTAQVLHDYDSFVHHLFNTTLIFRNYWFTGPDFITER